MILTRKQNEGIKIAVDRYKKKEKYVVISGYAGTGKTTIIKYIIEALNVDEERVCYCSFTGKATEVLRQKGNKNVCTLHKLLYESHPKPDGTFYKIPKLTLDYDIICIDEISLVPKTLMDLLFSHNCYVICCGDPAQLPPLSKEEDNRLLDHPHVFLDEIMRQAQESEIIRLTMKIRAGEPINYMQGKEVMVIDKGSFDNCIYLWADQILTATNKTRHKINSTVRKMLGRTSELPVDGDKMICLRNYWDIISDQENSLINGTVGYINNKFDTFYNIPKWAGGGRIDVTAADFTTDTQDDFGCLEMDTKMITKEEKCVDSKIEYKLCKNPKTKGLIPLEFTYGYAVTTHKAQGSSWPKVLVIEENFPFDKEEHKRWLYTACTRAEQKLVLVR